MRARTVRASLMLLSDYATVFIESCSNANEYCATNDGIARVRASHAFPVALSACSAKLSDLPCDFSISRISLRMLAIRRSIPGSLKPSSFTAGSILVITSSVV